MLGITPTYYAGGSRERKFELIGSGFTSIPTDAVGVLSQGNNDPLMWARDTEPFKLATVEVIDDTKAIVDNGVHNLGNNTYLGGIVSNNRQIVYWVNNTKPLP